MGRALALVEGFGRYTAVRSVFIGGSVASGLADRYSDLDIYLVATRSGLRRVLDQAHDVLRSCGELAFLKRVDHGFPMDIFIYSDGVKGELGFGTPETLADLHCGAYFVLLDRDGLLNGFVFPGWVLKQGERDAFLVNCLQWFWREAIFAGGYLARGDLWSAASQIAQMRDRVAALLRAAEPGHLSPQAGLEKLGRDVPDVRLDAVRESFFRLDGAEMNAAYHRLCGFARQYAAKELLPESQVAVQKIASLAEAL